MDLPVLGGAVSEMLFRQGLCLPSSSSLTPDEVDEVCHLIRREVNGA
jgi:dTDP-4-amino-4,6-dideoxygalactose transaminase